MRNAIDKEYDRTSTVATFGAIFGLMGLIGAVWAISQIFG